MGSHPCDARTAYILLRQAQDIFRDFKDQAAKCLPEVMRDLVMKIDSLQASNRQAQTAKLAADDAVQSAQDAVSAAADKATVVMALFAECAKAKAAPAPAPAGAPAGHPGA
jgi:hypothetical protein